jgi:hypothetical protein
MVTIRVTAVRLALVAAVVVFAMSWYLLSTEPNGAAVIDCPTLGPNGIPVVCGVQATYRSIIDVAFFSMSRALLVAVGLLALNWARRHVRVVGG